LVARVAGDKHLLFEEANHARIPVVTVDEGIPQPFGTRITSDDAPGIGHVLEHLTQLGHRKIGFIGSGFPGLYPTPENTGDIGTAREELFRRAMVERRLELPEGYVTRETTMVFGHAAESAIDDSSARAAVDALLAHPADGPPQSSAGAMKQPFFYPAVSAPGLRVPEDISVVGFSDISAARLFEPSLSTVQTP
jgi:LacI family transcriptional regulator